MAHGLFGAATVRQRRTSMNQGWPSRPLLSRWAEQIGSASTTSSPDQTNPRCMSLDIRAHVCRAQLRRQTRTLQHRPQVRTSSAETVDPTAKQGLEQAPAGRNSWPGASSLRVRSRRKLYRAGRRRAITPSVEQPDHFRSARQAIISRRSIEIRVRSGIIHFLALCLCKLNVEGPNPFARFAWCEAHAASASTPSLHPHPDLALLTSPCSPSHRSPPSSP